jgi:5-methyltetrahydrofolate--homocysteine methyltransferase
MATQTAYVTCHPSAGLPVDGSYSGTPEHLASFSRACLEEGLLDIVGGCCGTTPAHTRALADVVRDTAGRPRLRTPL